MVGEVAFALAPVLAPNAYALALAVVCDLALGDPVYRAHPVRLMGRTLQAIERGLRRVGADGYGGGIALFRRAVRAVGGGCRPVCSSWCMTRRRASRVDRSMRSCSTASLRSAICCVTGGGSSARLGRDDLDRARSGRVPSRWAATPTSWMPPRVAAPPSRVSARTSPTDSRAPLFWYVAGGLPGLVLFKVVSTMDSMVGYRTPTLSAVRVVRGTTGRLC